jgi:intraflagellar transport protein 56
LLWRGYCYSRLGGRTNYNLAKDAYLELLSGNFDGYDIPDVTCFFLAIVYFHLGQYSDTEEMTLLCEQHSELKSRILLHMAQKTKDETKLAKHRLDLSDAKDDVLSAAAVEFAFRHRYQEAVDVYRSILIASNVDDVALYVYTAMALFNMGRHEQSLEALSIYCQTQTNSVIAANLKACNMFHLYNCKAALHVLDALCDGKAKDENDLIRHNTIVFNDGEKALQVLPGLVNYVPEARLNLAISYIK